MELVENKLIDKARDLGFHSFFGLMTTVNRDCYHLWLADLQRWLREEMNIFVFVDYKLPPNLAQYNIWDNNTGFQRQVLMAFGDYEAALESGLREALKLLSPTE